LESGALDGVRFSTTNYFERAHKWTPIHVEASPYNFRNLVRNRPRATNINAALCSSPAASEVHFLDGKNGTSGGRATTGIAEFMRPEFAKAHHPEVHYILQHAVQI
jgi:hypothetical protein